MTSAIINSIRLKPAIFREPSMIDKQLSELWKQIAPNVLNSHKLLVCALTIQISDLISIISSIYEFFQSGSTSDLWLTHACMRSGRIKVSTQNFSTMREIFSGMNQISTDLLRIYGEPAQQCNTGPSEAKNQLRQITRLSSGFYLISACQVADTLR